MLCVVCYVRGDTCPLFNGDRCPHIKDAFGRGLIGIKERDACHFWTLVGLDMGKGQLKRLGIGNARAFIFSLLPVNDDFHAVELIV